MDRKTLLLIAWMILKIRQIQVLIWDSLLKLGPVFEVIDNTLMKFSPIFFPLLEYLENQILKFRPLFWKICALFSPLTQYIRVKVQPSRMQIWSTRERISSYIANRMVFFYHMIDELEAKETEKFQFPLCCLPVVAANEVVKSMEIAERIRLAITSRRMENLVKRASSKNPSKYIFDISNENTSVWLTNKKKTVAVVGETSIHINQKYCIGIRKLVPWLNYKHSILWNMTYVFKKLRRIIPIGEFELVLNTHELSEEFLKEILSIPEFRSIQTMTVVAEQIESDVLRILMDWCDKRMEFVILEDCNVPLDYRHEKAFKFSSIIYDDARWVKVEDLFTLENSDKVILCENILTAKDVNRFLKFWIESDLNMFRHFTMWAATLDILEVLVDLSVVKTSRDGQSFSMIKASRKLKILSIRIAENVLELRVYSPEESFSKEFKVLELMEQKKKTEQELLELGGYGVEAQRLTMEIRQLKKELDEICTFFDEKTAIIAAQ